MSESQTTDDIVDRLRGIYSMGPFGKRSFHGQFIPPINAEAADEIERLRAAFLLYLQTENECSFRTGRPCRDVERCGCWLEMQQYVESAP